MSRAEQNPDCRVLMLTTFDLDRYVYAALALGASGFLLKDVTPQHLAAAVRLINTGDALLSPSITRRLVERFATGDHRPGHPAGNPSGHRSDNPSGNRSGHAPGLPAVHRDLTSLTPRELKVLTLMGGGLSNAELARELTLSEATVKTHVARIFAKLALRDRAQAVVLAYETELVSPGGPAIQPPPKAC
ncbi:LuxR C-terminal-related transcriptional regulator [Streptomyces sp. NPDC056835]|uniref:LuxR C-terminal-related transcriptional regulator n=1 Tax=Streptomyces sp. NPDC056835 TaxID=3345956 RepID=UPI00368C7BB8